jgi:type I restriction-modification system DNA methylase subunit
MDYKKLTDDEVIDLCIEKDIEYLNPKTKKNYARTTLISRLKKLDKDVIITDDIIEDVIPNIEYKNEIIWTLSDDDKKNNDDYKEIESKLRSCIRCCHNYLYSNGSIVGNEASNDIILLFILKVLNYLYISNKDIIINKIQSLSLNKDYNKYLDILDNINNLKKITDGNDINSQYEDYMDDVVRCKLLPLIFTEDKDFILNTKNEENNIIKIINEFDKIIINDITIKAFSTISIYEYFNSGYEGKSKNKKLGQFFTPKKVINSILYGCQFKNMVDEFENPSIYDPCCGTAGLLCVLYNSCSNINIDNIYGCEISKDTIKYAIASLMLSTNSLFENLNKGCALSNNKFLFQNKKFDVIFTNPPFGTSLKYKDLKSKFDKNKPDNFNIKFEDIYPFECNNGVNLFIMNIIHSLNDNGICAVIVPDGELITSKALFYMRKYIIDNCKMLKIIAVESKAFEYTSIKTNVLIFKKQKGIDNHKNIEFMEINKDCNEVKLITIADLDKYYTFKLETENNDIINYELNKDIEIIKFGKMFDLIKGTIQSSKVIEDVDGDGVFINWSIYNKYKKINNSSLNGTNLFISTKLPNGKDKGYMVITYYNGKCNYCDLMSLCKLKEDFKDKINIKYIYYYLLDKKTYIEDKYQKGLGQKSLDLEKFNEMDILIPTIEKQQEIVKYLDGLDNKNKLFEYSNNKLFELLLNTTDINDRIELFNNIENANIDINNQITKLNELNNYKLKIVKYNSTTEFIEFGRMFDLIKGTIQSSKVIEDIDGDGVFINLSKNKEFKKIKDFELDNENIFISNVSPLGLIQYYNGKCCYSNLLYHIKLKDEFNDKINIKYIYYYLLDKKTYIEDKYQKGLANKSLNVEKFKLMKIPIPSIEKQEEIIEYCDNNLEIINNLKKTIENNKIMMKELF